jgi:hypothetical protein
MKTAARVFGAVLIAAALLAAISACTHEPAGLHYGPEAGGGLELPADAALDVELDFSVLQGRGPKTEWTEEELARLREGLESLVLIPVEEGFPALYRLDGGYSYQMTVQAGDDTILIYAGIDRSVNWVTVNGSHRYYSSENFEEYDGSLSNFFLSFR